MKKLKSFIYPFLAFLSILIVGLIYPFLNSPERGFNDLVTDFDRSIPFIDWFVIPYLFWYLFIGGSLLYICIKDRQHYYKTIVVYLICLFTCYTIYYYFQTGVFLRVIPKDQDLISQLLRFVYELDQPYNCFPSIHVFTSYLMMKAINTCSFRHFWNLFIINFLGIMIILSTLFIKQHVILDVVSAIALVEVVYIAISYAISQAKKRSLFQTLFVSLRENEAKKSA